MVLIRTVSGIDKDGKCTDKDGKCIDNDGKWY